MVYGPYRGLRGGSFLSLGSDLHASYRNGYDIPSRESYLLGFRVSEIPEPGTILLALFGLSLVRRRIPRSR